MCYETGNSGVCACGALQRPFHTCSQQDFQNKVQLSLHLNNLCLYTATEGVVEFALASVVP